MGKEAALQGAPFYFDLLEGRVITGQTALQMSLDEGSHPLDLVPLDELLRNPEIPIGEGRYAPLEVEGWTREQYVDRCQYINLVAGGLNRMILARAYRLGLNPSLKRIQSPQRFKSLSNLYRQAGINEAHIIGKFDDWPLERCVSYIQAIISACQYEYVPISRLPLKEIINRAAESGDVPTFRVLVRVSGHTLSGLLELAGYPDFTKYTHDGLANWGCRFMIVNDGLAPSTAHLRQLSRLGVGPSLKVIFRKDNFDSLDDFRHRSRLKLSAKLSEAEDSVRPLRFAEPLFHDGQPIHVRVRRSAQFRLVNRLLFDEKTGHKRLIALSSGTVNLVSQLRQYSPKLTEEYIIATAHELGVFDDIWKLETDMINLKLVA